MFNEGLRPGDTPCIRAAFGEALHVHALATTRALSSRRVCTALEITSLGRALPS